MRTYTIALSIVAHVVAVCALIIAPLLATDELPEPRTATEFIQVVALPEPPTPPPARAAAKPTVETPRVDAAPLTAPDGISPEPVIEPSVDPAPIDSGVIGFGNSSAVLEETVPPPPSPPKPVRVGGDVRPPQKLTDVAPVYPAIALAAHKEGVVILEAVIGE